MSDSWLPHIRTQYALILCERIDTKRLCGKVLSSLTNIMQADEAIGFIDNIISYDFFLDLKVSVIAVYIYHIRLCMCILGYSILYILCMLV